MKINHLGIAVRSAAEAGEFFEKVLGYRSGGEVLMEREGLKIAFWEGEGNRVELLEPLADKGALAGFLEKRGEGLHHICYEVEDVEAALERARAAGLRLIDEKPRPGAEGHPIAFLHPASTHGILMEFCEGHAETP